MPEGLPVRHRPRSSRYLLAMSPDPRDLMSDIVQENSAQVEQSGGRITLTFAPNTPLEVAVSYTHLTLPTKRIV